MDISVFVGVMFKNSMLPCTVVLINELIEVWSRFLKFKPRVVNLNPPFTVTCI